MENMLTDRDLLDINTFLELFKTDDAFILLEIIHPLIIRLLLDKFNEIGHSLLLMLNITGFLFPLYDLVQYGLFVPPLFHTYSDYAKGAYAYEQGHQYKQY